MKNLMKNLTIMIFAFAMLVGAAFATPITVNDVNIQEVNGEYQVVVSLDNANVAAGVKTDLSFTIEELGTTKNLGNYNVDSNSTEVFTFNLKEITDSYNVLKKGNSYQVTVSSDENSMTKAFLFGGEKTTSGLNLIFDNVKVNSQDIKGDLLQVINGETLNIEMRFSALGDFDNSRIMAFVEGYEHAPLVASTDIFSVKEGVSYVKTLSIPLPSDMNSEQEYKLRITGANDLSGITYKDYNIYVDTQRDRVDTLDLVMTPSSGVEPGQNIIANVRMKNRGQKSQDSVKVSVEIPELGVKESSYVSNLNSNEVATSDDMLLFVPEEAAAGQYKVLVSLSYDDGYDVSTSTYNLNVLAPEKVAEKNLLVSFKNNVELKAGVAKTFSFVVANPNSESKPISIADEENSWADVEISPSLAMVKGGESETFTVTVTAKSAIEGEKELPLLVKEGANVVSEVTVSTYVDKSSDDSINWVNVGLAVLLIIAIIILLALVIAIARKRGDNEDEEVSSSEEYY